MNDILLIFNFNVMLSLLANLLLAHNNISHENTKKNVIQLLKEVQLLQTRMNLSKCYVLATSGWICLWALPFYGDMLFNVYEFTFTKVPAGFIHYLLLFKVLSMSSDTYLLPYLFQCAVSARRFGTSAMDYFALLLRVAGLCVQCNNGHPFSTLSIHGAVSWCMFVCAIRRCRSAAPKKVLNSSVSYVIFSFRGLFSLHR